MANTTIQRRAQETAAMGSQQGPTMQQYIKQMSGEIKKALPSVMTPDRFTRMTLTALSSNQQLMQTTPPSFLGAMMNAAQLGLEPNTPLGQAYLIPYWNGKKHCLECQFQIGYKGMIDLAYRSGAVSTIISQVVYENDKFDYSYGLEPTLKHIPATGDRGDPKYVYAMFRTKDGGYGYEVMSIEEVQAHAKRYSKAYNNGPWQTNFEEMARKTLLKKVLKYAPLSSEFVRAIAQDETVKTEISPDMYEVPAVEIPYEADEETGKVASIEDGTQESENADEDGQQSFSAGS